MKPSFLFLSLSFPLFYTNTVFIANVKHRENVGVCRYISYFIVLYNDTTKQNRKRKRHVINLYDRDMRKCIISRDIN